MIIPAVTADQMAEVDRLMVEVYHVTLLQMMENAGRNLADCALDLSIGMIDPSFLVLCGAGNNGGGGLAAARHLINRGFRVDIVLINGVNQLKDIPQHQWSILEQMGIQALTKPHLGDYSLILDTIIGYGLKGAPRGHASQWIHRINLSATPILSLDVPSGFDATHGIPLDPCIRATATLTLALPKTGLLTQDAEHFVGDLFLADISVPEHLYKSIDLQVGPIFKDNPIIKIS